MKKKTVSDAGKQREKAEKKRKRQKRAAEKEYPAFSLCKNSVFYLAFLVFAVIFTQALHSPLSAELFWFAFSLPPILLLYAVTGIPSLCQSNTLDRETVQKEEPVTYEIILSNAGFLPYPHAEAELFCPSEDGVRCDIRRVGFSLAPFGTYRIGETVVFHYRGEYTIGIRNLYVYDPLKLFRIRIRVGNLRPVFVMPRRRVIPWETDSTASEINTTEVKNVSGTDRTELTGIREYMQGDGLRDIHWKLSSKTQDLLVKHYGRNACRNLYFLPDLAAVYAPEKDGPYEEDIDFYSADAVEEMTLGLMLSALGRESNVCTLLWHDRRADGIGAEVLYNELDFERVYPLFASAPLCEKEKTAEELCRYIPEAEGISVCIVTSRIDPGLPERLSRLLCDYAGLIRDGGISVFYFDPRKKIRAPDALREHIDADEDAEEKLRMAGIAVTVFREVP